MTDLNMSDLDLVFEEGVEKTTGRVLLSASEINSAGYIMDVHYAGLHILMVMDMLNNAYKDLFEQAVAEGLIEHQDCTCGECDVEDDE